MKQTLKSFGFLMVLLAVLVAGVARAEEEPYVILVSLDGFRWDYTQRGITPTFDKISQEGVSALSLQPVFPSKTFPNHFSIISGMYAEDHGILMNSFLDPFKNQRYSMRKPAEVTSAKWYLGEAFWETAERQGIKTASFFWPGSEMKLPYRHPTYFKKFDSRIPYTARIDTAMAWLQLPENKRPHFITLYFEEVDHMGHEDGPDSPQVNKAIRLADSLMATLLNDLKSIKMFAKTNVIIVSDHGMIGISSKRTVNIEKMLNGMNASVAGAGPVMMISAPKEDLDQVVARLKKNASHYHVYRRDREPDYFHFSRHPFIAPILVVADPGWYLINNWQAAHPERFRNKGTHGYDNHVINMHGIFYAEGPAFRKGYRTGTLKNIDIYPLLCKIFGIMPRRNVDGSLENIGFILNDRVAYRR